MSRKRRKQREANRARRARNAAVEAVTPEQYEAYARELIAFNRTEAIDLAFKVKQLIEQERNDEALDLALGIARVTGPDACRDCGGSGRIGTFMDHCRRCLGSGRDADEHCCRCGELGPQHLTKTTVDGTDGAKLEIDVYVCNRGV